ncbi:MAG: chemotaxis protein CheB [Clostridiales bacterium]
MAGYDIIVVGASAGGIEAISDLIVQFPEDMKASVFIVVHISAESPNMLPMIFGRRSQLKCVQAKDGEKIRNGTIYVAPPDYHLIIKDENIQITRGPKENRARPAIDPLFRSAAVNFGTRVIGILLSGMLDDGVSGLSSIKKCGGIAIVQHPEDALFPDMPLHALANVEVDYNLPVNKMGAVIYRLVKENKVNGNRNTPEHLKNEVEIAEKGVENDKEVSNDMSISSISGLVMTCPECNGPLFEIKDDKVLRFRCITGHAYTAENLLAQQNEVFEAALFAALRILQEKANMLERLYEESKSEDNKQGRDLKKRADESRKYASVIRDIILYRNI